jgi:hypothetical protein
LVRTSVAVCANAVPDPAITTSKSALKQTGVGEVSNA